MNIANTFDIEYRVKQVDRELSTARARLTREIRKNRQLQQQSSDYIEALTRAVQDNSVIRYHFELLSGSHFTLSQEVQKAKVMVETLEAVIEMLYLSSAKVSNRPESKPHGEHSMVDDRD